MSDIVERIRARPNDAPMPTEHLLDEAADEIDRLRDRLRIATEALLEAEAELYQVPPADNEQLRVLEIVRAALHAAALPATRGMEASNGELVQADTEQTESGLRSPEQGAR